MSPSCLVCCAILTNSGRLLDAYFSRAFYKQILGKTVDMRDLESIDPEYHKSLQWMLDNDITDVIDQEFTIEDDQFGEKKVVELKEGGAEISVTEENKEEYVRLVVGYRVENSIKDQIKSFLNGFYEVIPRKLVQIFEADQLERECDLFWPLVALTNSAHFRYHFGGCRRAQELYSDVWVEVWRPRDFVVLASTTIILARGASPIPDVCHFVVTSPLGRFHSVARCFWYPAVPDTKGQFSCCQYFTNADNVAILERRQSTSSEYLFQFVAFAQVRDV